MRRRSKLYRSQIEKVDRSISYQVKEAFKVLKAMPHVKFDETVDVAFKLGIDPKQTDQNIRGAIPLPKGSGKKVVVAVIAADAAAEEARKAGADFVGLDDIVAKIKGGWVDFDVLIATPSAMPLVRPLGRQLGPKGLMPNPKTGTVTDHVGKAVIEAKAGRVEYKTDKGACVHVAIGKMSFAPEDLAENCAAVINAVVKAKPSTAKGIYIQSCTVSSTMSPGVKVDVKEFMKVLA